MLSKNIINFRQNCLVASTIIIGGFSTVFATLECNHHSLLIITVLNTFVAVIVGLMGIFKLDAKGESFSVMSKYYNKLEMFVETTTTQLDEIHNMDERERFFCNQLRIVEKRIKSLNDDNAHSVPYLISMIYPVLSSFNFFEYIRMNYRLDERDNLIMMNETNVDIEKGDNVFDLFEKELLSEIRDGERYKSWMFVLSFYPPINRKNFELFAKYKLI
jgi:hypothetical protein